MMSAHVFDVILEDLSAANVSRSSQWTDLPGYRQSEIASRLPEKGAELLEPASNRTIQQAKKAVAINGYTNEIGWGKT